MEASCMHPYYSAVVVWSCNTELTEIYRIIWYRYMLPISNRAIWNPREEKSEQVTLDLCHTEPPYDAYVM